VRPWPRQHRNHPALHTAGRQDRRRWDPRRPSAPRHPAV